MTEYYTAMVFLSCLALCALSILVYENNRLDQNQKYRFYETYALIMLATITEWSAVFLNGAPEWTRGLHILVKCLDYCLTPVAGVLFVRQISERGKWQRPVLFLLLVNAVLEIISAFTGWIYYVDAENYYHHGPLYFIYVVVFCLAIAYVLFGFLVYGKNFNRQNRTSLYAIMLLVCLGVGLQEGLGSNMRTVCFSLAVGSVLLFIHYSEFLQLKNDNDMSYQKKLLATDNLTGLQSRYAYTEMLNAYKNQDVFPENLVAFVIDINGLKTVNDTLGHEAGDEMIQGAAACIAQVLGKYGACFRTGGDEFVAILRMDKGQIAEAQQALRDAAASWNGHTVEVLSFSTGYAIAAEHPGLSIEQIVHAADQMMYANKAAYYRQAGKDRRKQ
ncbi:MAG: diguanylate cyclase domain-containing protein [Peptococcaceae bacterium]